MGVTQRQDIYDVRGRLSERRYSIDGGASILSYEHTYSNGNRELCRVMAWGTHAPTYDFFLYDGNGRVRWAEYGSSLLSADSSTVSDSPVLQLPEGLTHSSTVTGDYSEGGYGRSFNYRSGNWDEVEDVTFRGEFWPSGFGIPTGTVSATERVLDPLGNVVRVENPRFTTLGLVYDGLSRLRRAVRADGVELEYIYRVDGLLQEKIRRCHGVVGCTDGHEVFVYDHRGLLLEIRDGQFINPVIARYYYAAFDGEVPIAMDLREEGGTNMIRYYSLSDRQGSIVGLMGEDGTVVERVAYDTWGVPWVTTSDTQTVAPYASSLGNRLLFQSHLWDPDVDLYFMRARVFDPFRGEFLQRDPSGYADSVNMYAGFAWDPVNLKDPTGHEVATTTAMAGACLGGAAFGVGAELVGAWWNGHETSLGQVSLAGGVGCIAGAVSVGSGVLAATRFTGEAAKWGAATIMGGISGGSTTRILSGERVTVGTVLYDGVTAIVAVPVGRAVGAVARGAMDLSKQATAAVVAPLGRAVRSTIGGARSVVSGAKRALMKRIFKDCFRCFVAGTPVLLASTSTAAVDELRVGDRVETYQQSTSSAPSTADWVRVRFEVRGEATDPVFDVEIIRPESEVLAQGIDGVGAQFQTSLFEYEEVGLATVLEYERGFKVRVGSGRLVVMTVNHLSNDVYEVGFGVASLRGTGSHPLYSLDRDDWVRVRDLRIGERLQTAEGAVSVEALEKVRGLHRVYNLEVEGDHEYFAGEAGVRAHNTCFRFDGTLLSAIARRVGGAWRFRTGRDLDWVGSGKGYREALDEAFRRTGLNRSDFDITRWGRTQHGKSVPVEWRHRSGAEVNIDIGHTTNGPRVPHVGYQTGGKRAAGATRGHILVDSVPANR